MQNKIRPGRWLFVLSGVIFVVGIFLYIYLLVFGFLFLNHNENRIAVPGKSTVEFDTAGKKYVFYEFNTVYNGKMYSTPQVISGLICSLKEENTGKDIELKKSNIYYEYARGSSEGRAVFEFEIDNPGSYVFEAWYEDNEGPKIIFVLGEGFSGDLLMIIMRSFLVLFLTTGTAILILVFTILKRNKSKKALREKTQT